MFVASASVIICGAQGTNFEQYALEGGGALEDASCDSRSVVAALRDGAAGAVVVWSRETRAELRRVGAPGPVSLCVLQEGEVTAVFRGARHAVDAAEEVAESGRQAECSC